MMQSTQQHLTLSHRADRAIGSVKACARPRAVAGLTALATLTALVALAPSSNVPALAALHQASGDSDRLMFQPARRDFLSGRLPRDLAPVDFDEDGREDAACVLFSFFGPGGVQLLRGDGAGNLTQAGLLTTAGGATSIAAVDLDEDGHVDLVTTGFLDHTLGLHRGDGTGGFTEESVPFAGEAPFHVLATDVNDDRHADLIVTASVSADVHVLLGDGQGALMPLPPIALGVAPQNAACGDLNGDGAVDLVVADAESGQVFVLAGDGSGNFTPVTTLFPGDRPVWSDIEEAAPPGRPGRLAVALRGDGVVRVYRWEAGAGAPVEETALDAGASPQAVCFHRFAPEHPGLAIAAQTSSELVLYEDLDAAPLQLTTQASPTAVRVGDWSGDGVADFLVPGFNTESVSLHIGDGAGGAEFAPGVPVAGSVAEVVPLDFDGGPQPDLAVLRILDRQVTVLRGLSPTEYEPIDIGTAFEQVPTGFAVLDLDGDQLPDFAAGQATGSILWVLESSTGYATAQHVLGGSGPTSFVAGDFDGDGDDDLAATLFLTATACVLWNDGAGGFEVPRVVPVGSGPLDLTAGDWNGDGRHDFAVVNSEDDTITIVLQDAAGDLHAVDTIAVEVGHARGVATGLLSGGRSADLVVTGNAGLEVLFGDGTGGFRSVQRIETAAEFERVRVADLDGDGFNDVIAADRLGNGVVVYPGDPRRRIGPLRPQLAFGTHRDPVALAPVDLDLDGRLDLAVVARTAGTVSLLLSGERGADLAATELDESSGVPSAAATSPRAPRTFALPNPFVSRTQITVDLAEIPAGRAELRIFDASGRLVARPFSGHTGSASLVVDWDGRDARGAALPRGVYFYRVDLEAMPPGARPLHGKIVRR
jgi:hypothetical protein